MKEIKVVFYLLLFGIGGLASCSDTDWVEEREEGSSSVPMLTASVQNTNLSRAAGDEIDEEGYVVMTNDQWKDWNIYIYDTAPSAYGEQVQTARPHTVDEKIAGKLKPADGLADLKWGGEHVDHTFYGWTEPDGVNLSADLTEGTIDYENKNIQFEYFIGTKRGPVNYADNGRSVDLKFERLVSRITVGSLTHIGPTGEIDGSVKDMIRSITFPNMPRNAKFVTGIGSGEKPHVEKADQELYGLSMKAGEENLYQDSARLYMSPFMFAKKNDVSGEYESTGVGKFYIVYGKLDAPESLKIYEGDLADIASQITGLKAGESMVLSFVMQDERITGFYVHLQMWNTKENKDVMNMPNRGIYSEEDFAELYMALSAGKEPPAKFVQEIDGQKVIRIYTTLSYPGFVGEMNIPSGYVLDGGGNNIICGKIEFTGEVRDLYMNDEPVE